MKSLTIFLVILGAVLGAFAPTASAGTNECQYGSQQDTQAVPGVLVAGAIRSSYCTDDQVSTITSVFRISMDWTGPGVLAGGATTAVNTIANNGCTVNPWVITTDVSAVASGGTATNVIFMSSATQCRADFELVVTFGTPVIHTYRHKFALNTDIATVDSAGRYCAAAAAGAACTTPTVNAAVTGSMTNTVAGALTVSDDANGWIVHQDPVTGEIAITGLTINQTIAGMNVTFARMALQLCGPDFIETGVCGPVQFTGQATTDNTPTVSVIFPLLLFLLLVVYVEIRQDLALVFLAVIVGAAVVIGLWSDVANLRSALIGIIIYLLFRGWQIYTTPQSDDY